MEGCANLTKYYMKTNKYEIDTVKQCVTIFFQKMYKYEIDSPFYLTTKFHKTNNGYAIQPTFESKIDYPIWIEQTIFLPDHDFEIEPLLVSGK